MATARTQTPALRAIACVGRIEPAGAMVQEVEDQRVQHLQGRGADGATMPARLVRAAVEVARAVPEADGRLLRHRLRSGRSVSCCPTTPARRHRSAAAAGRAGRWAWLGCSLAAPRPRDVRRGHEHPHGKKQGLRNGPELGETAGLSRHSSFPGLGRMFMARPHRRALAFLGFWVRQAPRSARRIGTASAGSLPNGIASLQGLFQPHARIGEAATGQSGSAVPPVTCIASLEASPVGRDRSGGWPAIEFPGSTPRHAVAGGIRGYDGVRCGFGVRRIEGVSSRPVRRIVLMDGR